MDLHLNDQFRHDDFISRHIGPSQDDIATMLATLGASSLDDLVAQSVPSHILISDPLDLPAPCSEDSALAELAALAASNATFVNLIGMGYVGTTTPPVIARNVLENPAWYTSYTPYQAEISQGRLEATLNFQTAVASLCGLDIANASLLDEGTAAAEAMTLCWRATKSASHRFFVESDIYPQTLAVLRTRAEPLGIELIVDSIDALGEHVEGVFGALACTPTGSGRVRDISDAATLLHAHGGLLAATTDLGACVLFRSPGSMGADVVVGSAQRFGVPLGFGGPHPGFIAVRSELARQLPGRLVGVSEDPSGAPALRLALQTREQHIRRERATSNICTAQALLANIAGMYCCWHGAEGLRKISELIHAQATALATALRAAEIEVVHESFFDTVAIASDDPAQAEAWIADARASGINLRRIDESTVGVTFDETTSNETVAKVAEVLGAALDMSAETIASKVPQDLWRDDPILDHEVFRRYRSEHEMLRYLRRLADRDLALDRTMIPLGSCTMKLNATSEMLPITWPEFANIHPYAPLEDSDGYRQMVDQLEHMLAEVTGYDRVSFQPNAGSQGEFAGLLAIREYHRSRGDAHRTVCLIPSSAHGTNAASAVMAGLEVVVVACDADGNVDTDDLDEKIEMVGDRLAGIMVTYPSTHGVYEPGIVDLCDRVHAGGGQVYVDGANMNALVGLAKPGLFGADVSHLNLHKTFCIPHGGGGPGVGPVAVRNHLAPFLPGEPGQAGSEVSASDAPTPDGVGAVSSAPYGSAGVLPISWVYLRLMGAEGLKRATQLALCNANYVAARLEDSYPVLYKGVDGRVAHECILDLRGLTKISGVTVEDVAKRLIDYGFHAPTVSFPVAGTLMVEPTESENLAELDRFCGAMIAIRLEIQQIIDGSIELERSPLRNAPHTAADIAGDWHRPYTRSVAAFPGGVVDKYFPPVGRVDNAHGDRNLVCDCGPIEAYAGSV